MSLTLPNFITRAVAFFDRGDAHFTATELLAAANAKIVTLEAEVVTHTATITGLNAQVATLTGEVAAEKAKLADKETELATANQATTDAKATAGAVIASQGLDAEKLPPLSPRADGAADTKNLTLTERCLAAKAKTNGAAVRN